MNQRQLAILAVFGTGAWVVWLIYSAVCQYLLTRSQAAAKDRILSRVGSPESLQVFLASEPGREFLRRLEPDPNEAATAFGKVSFSDIGPAVNAALLAAYEKENDVKLPADYRRFLLLHNGGVPEPSRLKIKGHGATPAFVERLYSLEVPDGPKVEDGLGDALLIHRANDWPMHYLPIARVRVSEQGVAYSRANLLLVVSGKKVGKVLLAFRTDMLAPGQEIDAMMTAMFESCCTNIAPSFEAFLAQLTPTK